MESIQRFGEFKEARRSRGEESRGGEGGGGTCVVRVANSTPMVDLESREKVFLVKRERRLDLPTPESPISTTLNR